MAQNSQLRMEEIREAARALLSLVGERARRILEARFGVVNGKPRTLQAVGDAEHLTRERVRQIEVAAMSQLRARDAGIPEGAASVRARLRGLLDRVGGAALEQTLQGTVGGRSGQDRGVLRFMMASLPGVAEASETKRTYAHWTITNGLPSRSDGTQAPPALETALEAAERILQQEGHVLAEDAFLTAVRRELATAVSDAALRSLLAVGKSIVRTPFGEWGLRGWADATPHSAGDKAYIVLRRAGKPLHFTVIAQTINQAGFDHKRVHPQTVHNELIRSPRFVLVGRGIYGLRQWGYEPGTVAEVLMRLLVAAGRPLPKTELVEAALAQRLVKRNTVLLALQNRRLFRDLGDGRFALVTAGSAGGATRGPAEATPPAAPAPPPAG